MRTSTPERKVALALEHHFGLDASGVTRQGLLELGRSVGITTSNVDQKLAEMGVDFEAEVLHKQPQSVVKKKNPRR